MIDENKVIAYGVKMILKHVHSGKLNRCAFRDDIADHFGLSLEIFDKTDLLDRVISIATVLYSIAV